MFRDIHVDPVLTSFKNACAFLITQKCLLNYAEIAMPEIEIFAFALRRQFFLKLLVKDSQAQSPVLLYNSLLKCEVCLFDAC